MVVVSDVITFPKLILSLFPNFNYEILIITDHNNMNWGAIYHHNTINWLNEGNQNMSYKCTFSKSCHKGWE